MISATLEGKLSSNTHIVSLDIGSSSVRSLLFDGNFDHIAHVGAQRKYEPDATKDGGVELDADELLQLTIECLDDLHGQMAAANLTAATVGISAFWHCFLGIDDQEKTTTRIIHLFDTRSGDQVKQLKRQLDPEGVHARTGAVIHTSYWPAKLLWLKENRPDQFARTRRWISFGEYLLLKIGGQSASSTSMVSASGIWNQFEDNYDRELLRVLPVHLEQLAKPEDLDRPVTALLPEFAARWPLFKAIPWCPAFGDGACNNIGSGCTHADRFAVMIGTSGAMRVVLSNDKVAIPGGIWCYRVNRERRILGGALSNGGDVFKWISRTLNLPDDAQQQLVTREPGSHQLTFLPYFAGERSPYWRSDLRAVVAGMSIATTAVDLLQAALEGVALRFLQIYELLVQGTAAPQEIVASGGGLSHSPVWTQMITDALGRVIVDSIEQEASSRGAALLAAQQVGLLPDLDSVPAHLGQRNQPAPERTAVYRQLLARDASLFKALYENQPALH